MGDQLGSLRQTFLESKGASAAKIAELVNNVDILVNVIRVHTHSKVRKGGGFEELGPLFEREYRLEASRRAAMSRKSRRWAEVSAKLPTDSTRRGARPGALHNIAAWSCIPLILELVGNRCPGAPVSSV